MRGIPKPVVEEAARTGDAPLPRGQHAFGYVVRDIYDKHHRLYTVGHRATLEEWKRVMQVTRP